MPFLQPSEQLTRTELVISKSRFITSIARCVTVSDAKAFLAEVNTEFPSASHHVYAFIIGHGESIIEGKSDDGEPSGTAGYPTLLVLRGSQLGNIVAVTTRFFGGTKLGTGGLVKAYTESIQLCLSTLKTEENIKLDHFTMLVPYKHFDLVKSILTSREVSGFHAQFSEQITITFDMQANNTPALNDAIRNATGGTVTLQR